MNQFAQRIAIAEACGARWNLFASGYAYLTLAPIAGEEWRLLPDGPGKHKIVLSDTIPDYLNDLNAMHEAEKVLEEQQQATYALFLHGNSKRVKVDHLGRDFDVCHATAAQRAEALLRTLGKWEESS